MSSVLRSLIVKVGADLSEFDKSMKKVSKNLKATGKDLSAAGATLTKGLTLPIVGAAAGLAGLAISAGKGADELITLSNKTGITTQALQEMQYAARFIDVEVATMTGSMAKLTKNMDMARRGSKEQEEAFARLGVEYKNQDGSLRNAKEVWAEAIDALGQVSSEADRDALAMNLFGKSAVELNPLIKAGSEELKRLGIEAHEVGAVMSDENVTALGKFDDSMQKLQAVLKNAGAEIGAAFIPVLEKLMPIIQEKIVPAIQSFAGFITTLIDGFSNMSPEMQGFVVALVGIAVAIGPIISVIGGIVTAVSGVIAGFGAASAVIAGGGGLIAALGALLGPVGIVLLVIAALAAAAYLIIKNWEPISEFFKNLWGSVTGWIVTAWDNIKNFFTNTWTNLKAFFSKWGVEILAVLFPFIGIPLVIAKHWDKIKEFISNIWNAVKTGTINAVTGIKDAIVNGITKAIDWIKNLPKQALTWGRDMIMGFIQGIKDKITGIVDTVKGVANKIKDFLHFSRPDEGPLRDYETWMPDFMQGLAKGIKDNKYLVKDAMSGLTGDMSINATMAERATSDNATRGIRITITGNTISNSMDINSIGDQLVRRLRMAGVNL